MNLLRYQYRIAGDDLDECMTGLVCVGVPCCMPCAWAMMATAESNLVDGTQRVGRVSDRYLVSTCAHSQVIVNGMAADSQQQQHQMQYQPQDQQQAVYAYNNEPIQIAQVIPNAQPVRGNGSNNQKVIPL
jgi:hypothetical protein